jgi:hypothetical protein
LSIGIIAGFSRVVLLPSTSSGVVWAGRRFFRISKLISFLFFKKAYGKRKSPLALD